jgi:phosphatidylglycerol:prolipoprotein diacylglycerol transferase
VGIPADAVRDVVFWGVIVGFIGARVAFIIVSWEAFLADPMALILSRQGFVFLGGLLAAIPCVWLVLRRWHVRFWPMADVLAPSLALAHAFGRGGCFFAGCCYGRPTELPWGVKFPRFIHWFGEPGDIDQLGVTSQGLIYDDHSNHWLGEIANSPAFYDQARDVSCPITWHDTHSLPIHPTQLYDVIIQIVLFAVLSWMWHRRRLHGMVFVLYLWLYSISRIVLEFFRGDPRGFIDATSISTSQVISTGLLVVAIALTVKRGSLLPAADTPVLTQPLESEESDSLKLTQPLESEEPDLPTPKASPPKRRRKH